MRFIHELPDVEDLFRNVAAEREVDPYLVEKDYWIMHALWGLQELGLEFELKGGTSLSKGYGIINRFSEDIDIKIITSEMEQVPTGRNHEKQRHTEKRRAYLEKLIDIIFIPGMTVSRDEDFDDKRLYRNIGIRLNYQGIFGELKGLKNGVLLEIGFDNTTPHEEKDISSWALDKIEILNISVKDNKARQVKCYYPEYTFVEKLQAITRKARQQKEKDDFPDNFLRHFYDIYQLFNQNRVKKFIGTSEYKAHKKERFRGADKEKLSANLAFNLGKDANLFEQYKINIHELEICFLMIRQRLNLYTM